MSEYKNCGVHYYEAHLDQCPLCLDGGDDDGLPGTRDGDDLEIYSDGETIGDLETEKLPTEGEGRTVIPDLDTMTPSNSTRRKLAGMLISYTIDKAGVYFPIYAGRNLIGRSPNCDIAVPNDMQISKPEHALIRFLENEYILSDEKSSNGVFVNGKYISTEPYKLKDGDKIRVGETVFLFRTTLM